MVAAGPANPGRPSDPRKRKRTTYWFYCERPVRFGERLRTMRAINAKTNGAMDDARNRRETHFGGLKFHDYRDNWSGAVFSPVSLRDFRIFCGPAREEGIFPPSTVWSQKRVKKHAKNCTKRDEKTAFTVERASQPPQS